MLRRNRKHDKTLQQQIKLHLTALDGCVNDLRGSVQPESRGGCSGKTGGSSDSRGGQTRAIAVYQQLSQTPTIVQYEGWVWGHPENTGFYFLYWFSLGSELSSANVTQTLRPPFQHERPSIKEVKRATSKMLGGFAHPAMTMKKSSLFQVSPR